MNDAQQLAHPASHISLNDLPKWSVWPGRLLGLEPWSVPVRTIEKVDREYDKDKYASCFRFYQNAKRTNFTPEDVKEFELGGDLGATVCVSQNNGLRAMPLREAMARQFSLLLETLRPAIEKATALVELGCGYGYNLWSLQRHFPAKLFVGGDYSANAVELAGALYKAYPNVSVRRFNFYDQRYDLLQQLENQGRIVIFTSHAIEQLPTISPILDTLARYRQQVLAVFHFEPVTELFDDSLLGLLCRRYTEANDYNRDLFSALQKCPDIRIAQVKANVFGWNPLNPTSIVQWEFAS